MSRRALLPVVVAVAWLIISSVKLWAESPATGFKDAAAATDFLNRHLTADAMRSTRFVIFAPRPDYPKQARERHLGGTIFVMLHVDKKSGLVTSVELVQSTGHKILDDAALATFRSWKFKPGVVTADAIPALFTFSPTNVIFAPKPEYPQYARDHHWTGAGWFVMHIDTRTGVVTSVEITQSTGHKILDDASVSALKRWRFKPGIVPPKVKAAITFPRTVEDKKSAN